MPVFQWYSECNTFWCNICNIQFWYSCIYLLQIKVHNFFFKTYFYVLFPIVRYIILICLFLHVTTSYFCRATAFLSTSLSGSLIIIPHFISLNTFTSWLCGNILSFMEPALCSVCDKCREVFWHIKRKVKTR